MNFFRRLLHMETEPSPQAFPAPLFIVGCMRSGTTFLVDKLTQHPQLLKVGAEMRGAWTELADAPCEGEYCAYRDESHFDSRATANLTHYFDRFIAESRRPRRYLMRAKNRLGRGLNAISYDWEHLIPVNKNTHLMNKLRYVRALFPQAKFVLIVRSIEGQSASMKSFAQHNYQRNGLIRHAPLEEQACWSLLPSEDLGADIDSERCYPGNFAVIPEMWLRLNALALHQTQDFDPDQMCVLRYEDLVQNQASILEQVFEFLRLDARHRATAQAIAQRPLSHKNTTTKGDSLQKWKRDLTGEEQMILSRMCEGKADTRAFIEQQLSARCLRPE